MLRCFSYTPTFIVEPNLKAAAERLPLLSLIIIQRFQPLLEVGLVSCNVLDKEEDDRRNDYTNARVDGEKEPVEIGDHKEKPKEYRRNGLRRHRRSVIVTGEGADLFAGAEFDDHREGVDVNERHSEALDEPQNDEPKRDSSAREPDRKGHNRPHRIAK